MVRLGAADGALDATLDGAAAVGSGAAGFAGSTGAAFGRAGSGVGSGFFSTGCGVGTGLGAGGGTDSERDGGGCSRGALVSVASLAVKTSSEVDDGAGISCCEIPSNMRACRAIEISRPQSKARCCRSGWKSPGLTADADMGQE